MSMTLMFTIAARIYFLHVGRRLVPDWREAASLLVVCVAWDGARLFLAAKTALRHTRT